MGRKVDLSGLTNDEAEHVLRVLRRDMKLRKKEEDRLSDLKHELEEEGRRCLLLAKQRGFNEQCCIRCCGPFSFFLKPRRICLDCRYNVCKACCSYSQNENGYVCAFCHKSRLLRAQSLEWYYKNVKSRFKRFGSAKVLKTLYKKHIIERGALSELPEVSVPEGSNDNDGSVCGSDSAFSKQSESHSIAETLTVALRVAEEAIEEAITKAEGYRDSLEKQNEARYLRDHREELVEELATTIVQKIIQRGKQRSEMQAEYDFVWSQTHNSDLPSPTSASSTRNTSQRSTVTEACRKHSWRSLSALSLTSEESPDKTPEADKESEAAEPESNLEIYPSFRRESRASILGWKNVDRLDNSSASSVLQSPDGNWIALQTSQHSRPSLLTKRKSLVFSVLEKESGVVSAYDEMGSDSEDGAERDSWGLALLQFRQRLSEETRSSDSQRDTEQYPPITSPSSGHFTNTETLNSDSENSVAPITRPHIPAQNESEPCLPYFPYDHYRPAIRSPHSPRLGALDVNFNPQVVGDSSEGEEQAEQIRRLRRRKRNKRESAEQSCEQDTLFTEENSTLLLNTMMIGRQDSRDIPNLLPPPTFQSPYTVTLPKHVTSTAMSPKFVYKNTVASNFMLPCTAMHNESENDTHELRSKLSVLVDQISKEELTSSDDEPMQKVTDRQCDGEREEKSDRARYRERKTEAHKENNGKIEMGRNKREMERLSERWIERQISRECGESEVVRQRHSERDQKKEGNDDLVKPMVERNCQVRQVETESENESKADNMKLVEIEPHMITQVNGLRMIRDFEENETQQMTINTDQAQEGWLGIKQSVEEELGEKGHYSTEDMENRGLLQINSSESGFETRMEAHNHSTPSDSEEQQSPTENYSAASLCSITTEVLKVLNATEELIGEAEGKSHDPHDSPARTPLSSGPDSRKLDQHLTKLEENVYLAAGTVYGLEGALIDLEDCARSISSSTTESEMAFLEDQVASAAAQVQQSELQISDIEARISALKNAGLNVSSRFPKLKPQTLDSSRQQRRKLPAPPAIEKSVAESRFLQP